MASKTVIISRLQFHRDALEKLQAAYIALIEGGVQQYSIGSRSLTRWDLSKIMEEIKYHEQAIEELEAAAEGKKRRRAVGVIPRDW